LFCSSSCIGIVLVSVMERGLVGVLERGLVGVLERGLVSVIKRGAVARGGEDWIPPLCLRQQLQAAMRSSVSVLLY
jgi:hypothetical protein